MKNILFIGFGLVPTRREAVSISFGNHIKHVLPKHTKHFVYSIPIKYTYFQHLYNLPKYFAEISKIIKNNKINIVHDMFVLPGISLLFIPSIKLFNRKIYIIKELHNNYGYTKKINFESIFRLVFSSKLLIRFVLHEFDCVYSRSRYISEYWNIKYIPQYIPQTKKRGRLNLSNKIVRFCYLGHPLAKKGVFLFPSVLKDIEKKYIGKLRFSFAFSDLGSKRKIVGAINESVRTNPQIVRFVEKTEAKYFFRKNHFFVLPLPDEFSATSVPNSLLESMEAGCIPIIPKNKVISSIISDGKNGIYMKEDLCKQINQITRDFNLHPQKYMKISREARKYINLNHDLGLIRGAFIKLYG